MVARAPSGTAATIRIRPIRPTDEVALLALYGDLSADARYARFLRTTRGISELEASGFCGLDHEHREGLVAEVLGGPEDGRLVGHLCLEPVDQEVVEMAVAVADDHRRQGIGRRLLRAAVDWAGTHGVDRLHATMLATNTPILALVRSAGLPVELHDPAAGVMTADIAVRPDPPGTHRTGPARGPGTAREEGAIR